MSRHHRAQRWTTHAPKLREKHARLLPAPCIECGSPVMPGQAWHVGHRQAASRGGQPTMQNTGPAHARCNLKSGGAMGAAVTNQARRRTRDVNNDIREW